MDRREKSKTASPYANERDVSARDTPLLEGGLGRETNQGADPGEVNEDEVRQPTGGARRSTVTDSAADETEDGLDANSNSIRRGAEETPIGPDRVSDDVPVFERGDTPPKV